jgi:iron complex transport system substrate-binding protein
VIIKYISFGVLMIVFTSMGCGKPGDPGAGGTRTTITDSMNRKVEVPSDPRRIGCLYAFAGHAVTMLGRGKDIVAVVRGLQRDILLTEINPAILDAAVPGQADQFNIEELMRVRPDILFVRESFALDKSSTEILNKLGIPFVVISFNTIEDQMKAFHLIGKAIGMEKKALEYNAYYKNCIDRVKKIAASVPAKKRLRVYHSINEPLKTGGASGISAEWTGLAGAVNVAAGKDGVTEAEKFVNMEQVLAWNPDVVFFNTDDSGERIRKDRQWSSIKAVKTGRVYRMPNGISRWGHPGSIEIPLAMLWTVSKLYPEYTGSIDMNRETRNYYTRFFNHEPSEETMKKILHRGGMRKGRGTGRHSQ